MSVRLLVAAAHNDVIGRSGGLPWNLPGDLRRFAATTRGQVLVMGRLTYESIVGSLGHPLPGRHSVVISSRPLRPSHPDVVAATCTSDAVRVAREETRARGLRDWFVIGGAQVYAQLLPIVDVVDLTRVHSEVDGDVRMPAGWLNEFALTRSDTAVDDDADFTYSFVRLERAGQI